jgi:predicted metal-binding protein
MMSDRTRAIETPWKTVILLCGKCARKMDGGYGSKGKHTLRDVLRAPLRAKRRRDVRVIETRCMGICPKKAVTALNASHPGKIFTIKKGTASEEVMARLMVDAEKPDKRMSPHRQDRPRS